MIRARRQDPRTVRTKRHVLNGILMGKGGDQLARGRIPELGALIRASRQDPSAVRTKRRVIDRILMVKGGYQFARSGIPELGGVVSRSPSGSEHRPD